MIKQRQMELNAIKDNYADIQYFWSVMKEMESTLDAATATTVDGAAAVEMYPENSVCIEIFPMFRELASEYAKIDYEHYVTPSLSYYDHLVKYRSIWFPEGEKSK